MMYVSTKRRSQLRKHEKIALIIVLVNITSGISFVINTQYDLIVAYVNLILYLFLLFRNKIHKFEIKELCILSAVTCYAFIVSLFNKNSIGAIVAFMELFIVLLIFRKYSFSISAWRAIAIFSVLVVMRYLPGIKEYYAVWVSNGKTLNPNVLAMFIYFAFIVLSYYETRTNMCRKRIIFFEWMLMIFCTYTLSCRTYTVAGIVVGILLFAAPQRLCNNKRFIISVIVLLAIGGCLFPYFYTLLINNDNLSRLIYEYTGKYLFTGRETMWIKFFEYELNNKTAFLFGAGSWIGKSFSSVFSLHNSYLQMVMNFGLVGLGMYLIYIIYIVNNVFNKCKHLEKYQSILIIGFIGFLVASYSEVVLQTPMYALLVGIVFASSNEKNKEEFIYDIFKEYNAGLQG